MRKFHAQLGIFALLVLTTTSIEDGYAQYGGDPAPTSEVILRCEELGIPIDECSERSILARLEKQLPITEAPEPTFDLTLVTGIIGATIGGAAIAVFLFLSRTRKETSQTSES